MSIGPADPSPVDFRLLFESAPGLYLVLTPDFHIVAASDAYLQATMTVREQIVGRHLFSVFPDNPNDPNATGVSNLSASLHRVVKTLRADTMAVQKYDVRRPPSQGGGFEERHWSPVNSPVLGQDGRLRFIIHRVEDVTEYVRLKRAALDESQANAEMTAKVVSMEAEVLERARALDFANRELRAMHEHLEQRVAERTAELEQRNAELKRATEARKDTAEALERTEAQLLHSQKLEALGQLAGGIAHDFNNLLTAILGFETLARLRMPADSPAHQDLEQIRRAGGRAADLTSQLLTFSRRRMRELHVLDLNAVIRDMVGMLTRLLGESIDLRVRTHAEPALVYADRSQIEQVVMNLVVNARDAMPAGGTLTIESDVLYLDESYVSRHLGAEPGHYSMLAVSDTGVGMDEALQTRIFEPFFTTKEVGKGTGLGLSTVYGIVKMSKGTIWLYSEVGHGTTFKVYLPRVMEPGGQAVALPQSASQARGGERLLLVEDNDQVRTVAAALLANAGYEVIPAASPEEALALARTPSVVFDAMVTDVVMPRMNGRHLAELVQAMRPATRVLFMSGYTNDVVLQTGELAPGVAFVQKPLHPADLTNKLRELLDRP